MLRCFAIPAPWAMHFNARLNQMVSNKRSYKTVLNALLDWTTIDGVISQYYTKGKSATGKSADDGLLLFKACLLQTWYRLNDNEVEDRINDSLSFSYFCGMSMDEVSPVHSTFSRLSSLMTKKISHSENKY